MLGLDVHHEELELPVATIFTFLKVSAPKSQGTSYLHSHTPISLVHTASSPAFQSLMRLVLTLHVTGGSERGHGRTHSSIAKMAWLKLLELSGNVSVLVVPVLPWTVVDCQLVPSTLTLRNVFVSPA